MTDIKAGLHEHTQRIKAEYPEPLCYLLIEMAEYNREKWLNPPLHKTYGSDEVRATGLTSNQQEWAETIAEALEDDNDE